MTKWISCLALLFVTVGCGQHPVDEARSIQDDFANEFCSCPDVVSSGGYANKDACVAENRSNITDSEADCLKAAYDRNESAASGPIKCIIDLYKQVKDCVKDASCNSAALAACGSSFDPDSCPALPDSVQEEFNACFPTGP